MGSQRTGASQHVFQFALRPPDAFESETTVDVSPTSKLIVLHVGPGPRSRGGITRTIEGYFQSDIATLYDMRWLSTQDDQNTVTKVRQLLHALIVSPWAFLRSHLVHIHMTSYTSFYRKTLFVLIARLAGRPIVLHIHSFDFLDFYDSGGRLRRRMVRFVLHLARHVVCLTDEMRRQLVDNDLATTATTIPNLILPPPAPDRTYEHEPQRVLFAGWIEQEKGVFDLLHAFAIATQHHPSLALIVAGKGQVYEAKNLVDQLEIADMVSFPGWLDATDLCKQMVAADIFVLPSYCEGQPLVLLEAMSAGLPIITCPVGGIPEMLSHGTSALFVRPGAHEELTAALLRLVANGSLRQSIGESAQNRFRDCFSHNQIVPLVESVYQKVLCP